MPSWFGVFVKFFMTENSFRIKLGKEY